MFLGLDISISGTGLVLLKDDYSIQNKTRLHVPHCGVERLYHLKNLLVDFLNGIDITFACLESPSYQSEKGQLFQLGEWTGIVKLQLFNHGICFISAAPSQLKKYIFGKFEKGSKKELVILDIYKKYGVEIRDNDIADAYVLSRIAHDYYFKYTSFKYNSAIKSDIKKYQIEVLERIYKTEKSNSDKKLI